MVQPGRDASAVVDYDQLLGQGFGGGGAGGVGEVEEEGVQPEAVFLGCFFHCLDCLAGGAAYSATKAALAALTRAWAAEFSPSGVRVNTIAPGPVYTGAPAERIAALGATTLFGRAAQADEIADAIAFLASSASGYVTGAVIPVDGGRTAV